jgi:O-antigen ligase
MAWTYGDRFDRAALWIAVALGFSIPVSTALDGLLMVLLVASWIAGGRFREKWETIRGNALALAACAFFLLHAAGSAWSIGSAADVLYALDKASMLLLAPILVSLRPGPEWRRRALAALLGALALTLVLSFPVWFGVMPDFDFVKGQPVDAVVFKKKIGHSVLMAFGAFALVLAVREALDVKRRVLLCLFAGLAAFNVFFMVWSRTGQLVLMVLGLFVLLATFGRRGALVAAAAGIAIAGAAYLIPSSSLHVRMLATVKEYNDWRAGKPDRLANTRLEAWTNSVQIVREHPLAGVGTGGFPAAYAKQVEGTSMPPLGQPENQYLLTTVQLGALGLAALLALLALQWRLAARLPTRVDADLARGLVLLMLVGCLFNSFLSDHTQALFHAWLCGLLYAGLRPAAARP